jgi:hypothetical protein
MNGSLSQLISGSVSDNRLGKNTQLPFAGFFGTNVLYSD